MTPAPEYAERRLQVLVVDDDEASRSLVCDQVADAGHDCLQAPDGRRALDVLHRARVDLVILDLEMPIMDGWELRRHMMGNAGWADVRTVVLSNHRDVDGEALRVEAVINKPIHTDRLMALLRDEARKRDRPAAQFPAPGRPATGDPSARAMSDSS